MAFHDRFYVRRENRDGYYKQPPGILEDGSANPEAENLHNLRKIKPNYYADLARDMDEYDTARFLGCQAGLEPQRQAGPHLLQRPAPCGRPDRWRSTRACR